VNDNMGISFYAMLSCFMSAEKVFRSVADYHVGWQRYITS
jgi:hypothetical protein